MLGLIHLHKLKITVESNHIKPIRCSLTFFIGIPNKLATTVPTFHKNTRNFGKLIFTLFLFLTIKLNKSNRKHEQE